MGCTSGKTTGDCKIISQKLENLITSYTSIEAYIQQLRLSTFENFSKELSPAELEQINLTESEKNEMVGMSTDLSIFKRFRNFNKYKYEILTSKFFRNIKTCMLKIQDIDSLNAKCLDELNAYRHTPRGAKISKPFERRVQQLQEHILRVTSYLENEETENPQNLTTSLSCNYYTLEINSNNSKRLNAYQFQSHSRQLSRETQERSSIPAF